MHRHGSKKKRTKNDERLLLSNSRNTASEFLEGLNKCLFCKKKASINLVRTNTIEKNKWKKGETTTEIEQKQFYKKRDEEMKKRSFFEKRRKQINVIEKKKQKKHKREREREREKT